MNPATIVALVALLAGQLLLSKIVQDLRRELERLTITSSDDPKSPRNQYRAKVRQQKEDLAELEAIQAKLAHMHAVSERQRAYLDDTTDRSQS